FALHCVLLAVAVCAIGLPAFDAIRKKRVSSWLVCLVVFYLVSFGVFGIEELFFREVWPSLLPFFAFALGLTISILNAAVLAFLDRRALERRAEPDARANADERPACG